MKLTSVWTSIVYLVDVLTFQTKDSNSPIPLQSPLEPIGDATTHRLTHPHSKPTDISVVNNWEDAKDDGKTYLTDGGVPIIPIPKNPQSGSKLIVCRYPSLRNTPWRGCHTPEDRSCWLRNENTNQKYDINTDYEDVTKVPVGVLRTFELEVGEEPMSPDGTTHEHAKVFNRQYPGPWLEACWGDYIEVKVTNKLRWNGTSVHWHGFRQFESGHMDGVNGVTECPIAPGETFTYRFRAMQYGSAWYHSHYSLQYGDGLLGPITIYGPSTDNYDSDGEFQPILMSDWNHHSVFQEWPDMQETGKAPQMTNILLNGKGQFGPGTQIKDKYQIRFEPGAKHKLVLINTAVDTTFVFSIDSHVLKVIEMDFVPIHPFTTRTLKIGIGQRYHVVIEGLERPWDYSRDGSFWIRTAPARRCSSFAYGPDSLTGVVRYDEDMVLPSNKAPLTEPYEPINVHCEDVDHRTIKPWREWTVRDPDNIRNDVDPTTLEPYEQWIFDVSKVKSRGPPYRPEHELGRWNMHTAPFRIEFDDPTLLKLDLLDNNYIRRAKAQDIVTFNSNGQGEKWIWMVLTASAVPILEGDAREFFPAAHPMHLHGHDFAVMFQTELPWYDVKLRDGQVMTGMKDLFIGNMKCSNTAFEGRCDNPARRDSILLPAGGFAIIAFKADNPGAWIFHCHIAFHASSGLAIQLLENKDKIDGTISAADRAEMRRQCEKWEDWRFETKNLWDPHHPEDFQDDSGV